VETYDNVADEQLVYAGLLQAYEEDLSTPLLVLMISGKILLKFSMCTGNQRSWNLNKSRIVPLTTERNDFGSLHNFLPNPTYLLALHRLRLLK
jgi:hypothetical protein